jgi:ribosomal protein S1
MIAELNHETRKIIVSQKTVLGQEDFDALVKNIKTGAKVDAIVSHVTPFGIFVSIPVKNKGEEAFLDGFVHISEISWERVNDLYGMFNVGEALEAVVQNIDSGAKRVELSIKKLTVDPYEELLKQYKVDQKVTGTVSKITESGLVVDLGEEGQEVEGFVRKEKIPPTVKYDVGQKITVTVSQVDAKKHRVYLTPVLLEKPLTYR